MLGMGLKTELWNTYKGYITKQAQGYSKAMTNVKGATGLSSNKATAPVVNLDTVLADVYYMAYISVGGKKDKLNGKLFNLNGVSQIMWVYFMCMRAIALDFKSHKKDNQTSPYILNDIKRIVESKGLTCNIQDRGPGGAAIQIGLFQSGVSGVVRYSHMPTLLNWMTSTFASIFEMQLRSVLSYNEMEYVKNTMASLGKAVVKELY